MPADKTVTDNFFSGIFFNHKSTGILCSFMYCKMVKAKYTHVYLLKYFEYECRNKLDFMMTACNIYYMQNMVTFTVDLFSHATLIFGCFDVIYPNDNFTYKMDRNFYPQMFSCPTVYHMSSRQFTIITYSHFYPTFHKQYQAFTTTRLLYSPQ